MLICLNVELSQFSGVGEGVAGGATAPPTLGHDCP